jgi:hypothetical protein
MTYQLEASAYRSPEPAPPAGGWLTAVLRPAGTLEGAVQAAGVPAATLAADALPDSAQSASGSPASRSTTRRITAWSSSPRPLQRTAP